MGSYSHVEAICTDEYFVLSGFDVSESIHYN